MSPSPMHILRLHLQTTDLHKKMSVSLYDINAARHRSLPSVTFSKSPH